MHKNILTIGITFLFLGTCINPSVAIDNAKIASISTSNGYIQDLINNASDGDTIYIPSGIYYENIVIDKSLNLFGENKNTTIIDGNGEGDVIQITADWVNISGFTVQNSGDWRTEAGFDIISNHNTIAGNIISNNGDGIELYESTKNMIYENIISLNEEGGIDIDKSNYNIVTMNNIFQNKHYGVLVFNSNSNNITNNEIYENKLHGISIQNGSYNRIIDNKIYGHKSVSNVWGIFTFKENLGNIISENTISDNWGAIDYMGINSIIRNNTIINNTNYGIFLDSPGWLPCRNNTITNNNFIGNGKNAIFMVNIFSNNKWVRNYWSDWPIKLPKPIIGRCFIFNSIIIPWFNFDWHPAKLPYFDEAESASVVVRASNSKIKMTLVCGGQNYLSSGYSFAIDVTIRLNGTVLPESNLEGNTGWEVGESLYIGGSTPILDDEESAVDLLNSGYYTITITIIETVIFDDIVTIV